MGKKSIFGDNINKGEPWKNIRKAKSLQLTLTSVFLMFSASPPCVVWNNKVYYGIKLLQSTFKKSSLMKSTFKYDNPSTPLVKTKENKQIKTRMIIAYKNENGSSQGWGGGWEGWMREGVKKIWK